MLNIFQCYLNKKLFMKPKMYQYRISHRFTSIIVFHARLLFKFRAKTDFEVLKDKDFRNLSL